MRIAALYDIHGNLPALEAVLGAVRDAGVDGIVVGGDVFPGPMGGDCLQLLLDLELPVRFLRGNGDRAVLALARGSPVDGVPEPHLRAMQWEADRLLPAHRREVAGWPETIRIGVEGIGEVLFCHATPRSDSEVFTRETPDDRLAEIFAGCDTSLVLCGHTHMQFDRQLGEIRVVNAGSVGMPFGEPGAYWSLLGAGVEQRCTPFDLDAAAARIAASGHPRARDFARRNVLRPPTERQMLDLFERRVAPGSGESPAPESP